MIDFAREKICFYNSMYQGRSSAFEIADFAARHGAAGIELMSFCEELREPDMTAAKEIGKYIKARSLAVPCFSTVAKLVFEEREEYVERLKKYAEICSELEIPYLHHTVDSYWGRNDSEDDKARFIELGAEATARVNDYAAPLGVKTVIEDQGYLFNGVKNYARLRELTGNKIGTLLDSGNIYFMDETAVDFAKANKDSICHVHIKDYRYILPEECDKWHYTSAGGKGFVGCPLGEGIADLEELSRILKSGGYNGYYSIELEGGKSPSDFLVAMEYIEKTFS